jgi:aminopeptidase
MSIQSCWGATCRLTDDEPLAAWKSRFDTLSTVAARLDALPLDALRYQGTGTDLTIGLLPSSRWQAGHDLDG